MSQYEVYDGPVDPLSEGAAGVPAYDSSGRYDERSAGTEVLARVPDLDDVSERSTIALCQAGATARGSMSGSARRSIATTAALMFLAAVAGFMLGRSGRSESGDEPETWRPAPPAASAPEAPVWNGTGALKPPTPRASSDLALPAFSSPPPATETPAAPAGSLGATPTPSDDVPKSTPWHYPGTTNVPAAEQTQTEANRRMTLEAPSVPANDYRGTQYPSGYGSGGYGATSDPRMASRPETRTLPPPPAQGQYRTTPSPTYPQTVYPDARSQPSHLDTRSIPKSTPYPAYPSAYPSTTPR